MAALIQGGRKQKKGNRHEAIGNRKERQKAKKQARERDREAWFVFVVSLTGGLQDFGNSRKAERVPRTVVVMCNFHVSRILKISK